MAAKTFTLNNPGTIPVTIQTINFRDPPGIGHIADLTNLGGTSNVTGSATLSYNLAVGASQTFSIDYINTTAATGTYEGRVMISGSDRASTVITSTIVVSAPVTTTTPTPTTPTPTTPTPTTPTPTTPTPTTTTAAPPSGGVVSPLGFNGKTYTYTKSTSGVAKLTLRLFDNGIWQIIPSHVGDPPVVGPAGSNDLVAWALITGNWYTPQTAGIGSGYLYQLTVDAFTANDGGDVYPDNTDPGPWLPFTETGAPELAYAALLPGSMSGEAFGDFTVKIAVNNGGTPGTILSTSTISLNGSRGA